MFSLTQAIGVNGMARRELVPRKCQCDSNLRDLIITRLSRVNRRRERRHLATASG